MILTKIPSENPYAASEKIVWLKRHLPILEDLIIITPDKGCIGTSRDTLVDDFPEWANAHNFPGQIIQFGGQPKLDEYVLRAGHLWAKNWSTLIEMFKELKLPSSKPDHRDQRCPLTR